MRKNWLNISLIVALLISLTIVPIAAQVGTIRVFQGVFADNVRIGTNPAAAGSVRVSNSGTFSGRNAANTSDIVGVEIDSANNVNIGQFSAKIQAVANLEPATDNAYALGSGTKRWQLLEIAGSIRIGSSPATAGGLRFGNATSIYWRNAANSADLGGIFVDSSNRLFLGDQAAEIIFGKALVALGGGSTATLGTIGGSGPVTAAQNTWMRWVDSSGATFWVPAWK